MARPKTGWVVAVLALGFMVIAGWMGFIQWQEKTAKSNISKAQTLRTEFCRRLLADDKAGAMNYISGSVSGRPGLKTLLDRPWNYAVCEDDGPLKHAGSGSRTAECDQFVQGMRIVPTGEWIHALRHGHGKSLPMKMKPDPAVFFFYGCTSYVPFTQLEDIEVELYWVRDNSIQDIEHLNLGN